MQRSYYSGLDLGQAQDFTAWAVLEQTRQPDPDRPGGRMLTHYALRYLERMPLGTPYPDVCTRLKECYAKAPLTGSVLAVDETGVGRPVVGPLPIF